MSTFLGVLILIDVVLLLVLVWFLVMHCGGCSPFQHKNNFRDYVTDENGKRHYVDDEQDAKLPLCQSRDIEDAKLPLCQSRDIDN